jgi:radical SAM superfamily enzyme YgiQ (UPF0313 family)
MNVLLVSPRTPDTFWSFRHALPFISKKAGHPPLGLLTIAAFLPRSWNLKLVDLNVSPLSDPEIRWADYVMVGAMLIHRESVKEISLRCRALGKPVIGGGPLFTTGRGSFPEIPHLVLGEAEELLPDLVADMAAGSVRPVYEAERRPDLRLTPVPRWDLIRFNDYACMSVQFCRGCPFDCEFCDVILLNGRVPRTKTSDQVIRELEALRTAGWKGSVFLVDDNFLGHKRRVRELLHEMIEWRARTGARYDFLTEVSVNLASEPELLRLMVQAGFKKVFVGIETPDPETLSACNKLQNTRCDLREVVRVIQAAGMEVMGGFIVGFDGDTPDIFQRQFDFIQKTGVVTAMVGLLNALPGTRLHKRLAQEGRLLGESDGHNTKASCNFVTKLGRDELLTGYRNLMRRLYEPNTYYERARVLLQNWHPRGPEMRLGWRDILAFLRSLWHLGVLNSGRRAYWRYLGYALVHHPRAFGFAAALAIYGHHFRVVAQEL